MVDPGAGPPAVPGGGRELRAALRGEGQHRQPDARTAAADLRQAGPHRPGRDDALHPEAIPGLDSGHRAQAVRRPRTLPHDRQRLARSRRRDARMAPGDERSIDLGRSDDRLTYASKPERWRSGTATPTTNATSYLIAAPLINVP